MMFKRTANYWIPVLIVILLAGLTWLNWSISPVAGAGDAFAPRWVAARQWMKGGLSPYSAETGEALQDLLLKEGAAPSSGTVEGFTDPVFYLFLYIPFSFLPYPLAHALWMTVSECACLIMLVLSLRLAGLELPWWQELLVCLLGMGFFPGLKLIVNASSEPLLMMLVLLGVYLAVKKETSMAGILLAFSFGMLPLSFIVALFFMLWWGARRDYGLPRLYFSCLVFLVLLALILFPGWPSEWFAAWINRYSSLSWLDTPLMRVGAFFPGASQQISILLHSLVLFALLVEWYGMPRTEGRGMTWKLMVSIVCIYCLSYSGSAVSYYLLFPPLFTLFKYFTEKWKFSGKILSAVLYIALLYFYWTRFQTSPSWLSRESSAGVLLILLVVSLGLQGFRWWAMVSSQAMIENR